MTTLNDLLLRIVGMVIKSGGTVASEEQAQERANICSGCNHIGNVRPLPLVTCSGCTICTCPIATKTKIVKMLRLPGKVGTPLTASEVAKIAVIRTTGGELVTEIVACPDTTNRWAEVDSKYL